MISITNLRLAEILLIENSNYALLTGEIIIISIIVFMNIENPQTRKKIVNCILLLVVAIGFIFRVWHLSTNPPELFSDELVNITSARNVIENGHDNEGQLALYFSDRVEMRPPIYGYFAYFSTLLFGDNAFAIRFPAVIFGLLAIVIVFFLTDELTKSKTASLLSALVLAIMPWHIHYSRVGWEPAALLPFLLGGALLILKGVKHRKKTLLILGAILLGLTTYTYQAAPLLAFLFLVLLAILKFDFLRKNKSLALAIILTEIAAVLPYLYMITHFPALLDRAGRINTFAAGISLETLRIFFHNYLSHFGASFMFLRGDPNLRHSSQTGEMYWWMLPFIIAGIVFAIQNFKKWGVFLIGWLLIFPLAASLTNDGVPHATRSLIGAPCFAILTGIGLYFILALIKKYKIGWLAWVLPLVLCLIVSSELGRFARQYFINYPILSQSSWNYGNRQAFQRVRELAPAYQNLCLENLNYYSYEPLTQYYLSGLKINKIENVSDPRCFEPKSISVKSEFQSSGKLDQVIYDLNNAPLYYIYVND